MAITGFGAPFDPFATDVTLFSTGDGVIELVQQPGTNQTLAIDRATLQENVYTSHPPSTPGGPPDGETAVSKIDFTFDVPAPGARPFITTPPSCSRDRHWTTVGHFTFDEALDVASSATPCSPPGDETSPPGRSSPQIRPRLSVDPVQVPRGRSRRFRFRLSGMPAGCRRAALVRLAGGSAHTSDTGRTAVRVRLNRRGLHLAVASKRGCPTARATVVAT
jgi:hypothetical protein